MYNILSFLLVEDDTIHVAQNKLNRDLNFLDSFRLDHHQ